MLVFLTTTIVFAQNNYQDVLYLRNGSVIRGVIIEQVPNESLKIETPDGNLFVFKMNEVEKMTIFSATSQNGYQDVVYLKNGSIIRGTITEQVSNESLKIETPDGNLFVCKMDEIKKMTKEHVAAKTQNTASSQSIPQTTRQSISQNARSAQSAQSAQSVPQQSVATNATSPAFSFGVKGGLNGANGIIANDEDNNQVDGRIGIHAGFFMEVPISPKVSFQPELVYSMQGDGVKYGRTTFTMKIDYINLPLIFKINVWQQRLSIDVGLQLGYMISAKISGGGETDDLSDYYDLNKFDASFGLGMSYKLTDKFDLALRVNIGATNVIKDEEDNRNMVFQLGVGYKF